MYSCTCSPDLSRRFIIVLVILQPMAHRQHQSTPPTQVGRAGRFGTKGLAITFCSSEADSVVLNTVQERFDVDIKALPDKIDSR